MSYIKSSQIFHYTRCNTPKRVTSLRGTSPRHCARATHLLLKKCHNGGEPLATLCPIWPVRELNLRPPAPETNALPLDQLSLFQMIPFFFLRNFLALKPKSRNLLLQNLVQKRSHGSQTAIRVSRWYKSLHHFKVQLFPSYKQKTVILHFAQVSCKKITRRVSRWNKHQTDQKSVKLSSEKILWLWAPLSSKIHTGSKRGRAHRKGPQYQEFLLIFIENIYRNNELRSMYKQQPFLNPVLYSINDVLASTSDLVSL